MLPLATILSVLWILTFDCKFLSIKIPNEPSFIPIDAFNSILLLSFNGSLANIVMDHNVEIIISSSRQVKLGSKLLEIPGRDYPQPKMIELVNRDIYDGIHLSKRKDLFVVHSLLFEIDKPFPISKDRDWSCRIECPKGEGPTITFFGPSVLVLYEIVKTLFKEGNRIIQFFKNSSLIGSLKTFHQLKQGKQLNLKKLIASLQAYYVSIEENSCKIRHMTNTKDSLPYHHTRVCYVNCEPQLTLEGAIMSIRELLKTNGSFRISNKHDHDNNWNNHVNGLLAFNSQELDIDKFSSTFHDIVELFFNLIIETPILIAYDKTSQDLWIYYTEGIFLSPIRRYFINFFEKHSIKYKDYMRFNPSKKMFTTLMIEDQSGHTFQYQFEKVGQLNFDLILPSTKRIILFRYKFSHDFYARRISSSLSSSGHYGSKLKESDLASLLEKWDSNNELTKREDGGYEGMEIILDHENHQISQNFLEIIPVDLATPITRFTSAALESSYRWILFLPDFEHKGILFKTYFNSYQVLLNLWKIMPEDWLILIQRSTLSSFVDVFLEPNEGTIELEIFEERHQKVLLEFLLSIKPLYKISEFRLRHGFVIEIDFVNPSDVERFRTFMSKSLKMTLVLSNPISDQLEEEYSEESPTSPHDDHDSINETTIDSGKLNILGNLTRHKAIDMLLENKTPLPDSSMIQVIERQGDYQFDDNHDNNIAIIHYKRKEELKEYILNIINKKNQFVRRIGKVEGHRNINFDFVFIQFASRNQKNKEDNHSNKPNTKTTPSSYSHEYGTNYKILFFKMEKMEKINDLVNRIIIEFRKIEIS